MRRDFATDSPSSTTELRAVVVAGSLGSGAALVADIVADVARLSFGRVERRRKTAAIGRRSLAVERLDIDATTADRSRRRVGLAIVCDTAAAEVYSADALPADERIVVDDPAGDAVPAWRQAILPVAPAPAAAMLRSIDVTARAAALVSRRMPYDRGLWRRSLARHVPKRYREAALARFDAEAGA
jgi:hypothetical protein